MQFFFYNVFLFAVFLVFIPLSVLSKETTIPYNNFTLNGNLELAEGKSLKDGIILITHGTLAHNKMEIIASLQQILTERGINTLAINLSLGINNRHGMYDCGITHTHKHVDALHEISAWVTWLKEKGANKIVLAGHSRGGNQTARYLIQKKSSGVAGAVLIAPSIWEKQKAERTYYDRHKIPLNSLLNRMKRDITEKKGNKIHKNLGFMHCNNSPVTASAFIGYYGNDKHFDTPTVLKIVKRPVLVIAGSADTIVKNLPERMREITNQNIKFSIVEGADHFFLDFYIEDAADEIEFFLNDLLEK